MEEIFGDFEDELRELISFDQKRDLDNKLKVYFTQGFDKMKKDATVICHRKGS